ncbi:hypothetical protein MTO96_026156 [Rhipicephalus appendiculatus]
MEAWKMLSTEVHVEPALDVQLFTRFIPALMCLMVDDQMRSLSSRLKQNDEGSSSATTDDSGPIPDIFQTLPPARLNNLMNKLQPFAEAIEELKAPFHALEEKIDHVTLQAAAHSSADVPLPRSPAMAPM